MLPEIHIRLEVDGEVLKQYHLQPPYTSGQRDNVIENLQSFLPGRDYVEAFLVIAPVYMETRSVLPIRNKVNRENRNYSRNDIPIIDFVKDNMDLCAKVNALFVKDKDYRKTAKRDNARELVALAREVLEYSPGTYDGDILRRLVTAYKTALKAHDKH